MEDPISSCWSRAESVPENYTFPPEIRPGKSLIPDCGMIPVINLSKATVAGRMDVIQQVMEAAQNFGFFQVIDHGVPEDIIRDTVGVFKEYFNMPVEDKAGVPNKSGWLYINSPDYAVNGVHLWRENIKIPCRQPLDDCIHCWPENPPRYREVVSAYLEQVSKLSSTILELICEGLGLETGYLEKSSQVQLLSANKYPPCPDPSLTLGILKHRDPSFITIVFQGDVCGIQVLKDGEWIGVGAIPGAFVVNVGNQLEIISNGKVRSAEHRAVTNAEEERMSIATFVNPCPGCLVEPAKTLVDDRNPPVCKPIVYSDFVYSSNAFGLETEALQNRMTTTLPVKITTNNVN